MGQILLSSGKSVVSSGGGGGMTTKDIVYREVVRLDGNSGTVNAVAARTAVKSKDGLSTLLPAVAIVPGTTFVLTGHHNSWVIIFSRETDPDTEIDINGITYRAGAGPFYATNLPGVESGSVGVLTQDVTFTAGADCFCEIQITRTYE